MAWYIEFASGATYEYNNIEDWEYEIDVVADTCPFDLDVVGNVCYVDDGDFED